MSNNADDRSALHDAIMTAIEAHLTLDGEQILCVLATVAGMVIGVAPDNAARDWVLKKFVEHVERVAKTAEAPCWDTQLTTRGLRREKPEEPSHCR